MLVTCEHSKTWSAGKATPTDLGQLALAPNSHQRHSHLGDLEVLARRSSMKKNGTTSWRNSTSAMLLLRTAVGRSLKRFRSSMCERWNDENKNTAAEKLGLAVTHLRPAAVRYLIRTDSHSVLIRLSLYIQTAKNCCCCATLLLLSFQCKPSECFKYLQMAVYVRAVKGLFVLAFPMGLCVMPGQGFLPKELDDWPWHFPRAFGSCLGQASCPMIGPGLLSSPLITHVLDNVWSPAELL